MVSFIQKDLLQNLDNIRYKGWIVQYNSLDDSVIILFHESSNIHVEFRRWFFYPMISKLDFFVKILNWYPFNLKQRRPPIPTNVRWNLRVKTLFSNSSHVEGVDSKKSQAAVQSMQKANWNRWWCQIFGKNAPKFNEWFTFHKSAGLQKEIPWWEPWFFKFHLFNKEISTFRFLGTFKSHEYFDKVNLLNMFFLFCEFRDVVDCSRENQSGTMMVESWTLTNKWFN